MNIEHYFNTMSFTRGGIEREVEEGNDSCKDVALGLEEGKDVEEVEVYTDRGQRQLQEPRGRRCRRLRRPRRGRRSPGPG